ncbi:alpha/beta family hydrolase [Pseudidiomarina terrestris]|uniref:Alpha/beta hydrolase n=1 Tax=Pseudidiomarina terrestris TaxID=2820060 RepID=A0AAW7QTC3_9GAMM|nr:MULTISPECIES: alpha/beta family hydrolase [unclassified Pseudidiomarina]MDN7123536.1 alpha/beta hydrolase [Pseudidiomarina sp. 1APP75-32.1]MDN7126674.1 alpha/beta hydrolase [Pseudidiomarina sp. 1APR75-33.1]MDN7128740.1 alpha/beta hydrolase [Pseudidiomarina sp. 1APR75-15]MDN7135001.1 alpha/beta hydrolase [Pseudidiomarina sp. 1ASP75-5]MDN7137672.1 alpha/beta hydrolase [Pseudidiomarina sp. 1ASP75-14]
MSDSQRVAVHRDNPEGAVRVIFAHGAGAGLQSDFMQYFALALAMNDVDVVRFNFPYWQKFMDTGVRRPPNPMPQLEHCMRTVIEQFDDDKPLFLMGKSMGARVAFRLADEAKAEAAIALGFPFHPIGKPDKLRLDDLVNQCPKNLIIQGERDGFGKPEEVASYQLPDTIAMHWLSYGDHSFEPTKRSGLERRTLWQEAVDTVRGFITERT